MELDPTSELVVDLLLANTIILTLYHLKNWAELLPMFNFYCYPGVGVNSDIYPSSLVNVGWILFLIFTTGICSVDGILCI